MATTTTTNEAPQLSYVQVPETSENLDWADLRTFDLSKFDQPGGKQELAADLLQAIEDVGTFNISFCFSALMQSG
jgi:hypothetical protein